MDDIGKVTVDLDDLAPRARIREIALSLFARHGPRGTSIRMIAEAAGVSPSAVMHHYASKAEIEEAVRTTVVERVRSAVHGVGIGTSTLAALFARREANDRFLDQNPVIREYLRHAYKDGGPEAISLWRELGTLQRKEMEELVEAGIARPLPDPEVGMLLYRAINVSATMLRPFFEAELGVSLDDPDIRRRLHEAEIDLLTKPLFPLAE